VYKRQIFGVGLDRDNDGFGIDDGTSFTNGIAEITSGQASGGDADGAAPTDGDDTYLEGWNTAFWGYYVSDGASDWGFASTGFTDRQLGDGDWDGWSFQPGFSGNAPSVPVPEPGSAALIALSGLLIARRRR